MIVWTLVALLLVALGNVLLMLARERCRASAEIKDATERALVSEAKAKNSDQKLKALSESSGAGIVILNAHDNVLHLNTTAEHLLGIDPEALVGHSLIQATMSNDLQGFIFEAISLQRARTEDFRLPGASGRYLRASIYPFKSGYSGEPESMLVLVDVTEIRKLETIRRDFVANVSHELRTPLTSIKAMAETLQDGALEDPEVAQSFLATIIKEADRLARISEDLLILSDAESKAPTKTSFDMSELVREAVGRFRAESAECGVSLELIVPGPVQVVASRDQLDQVIVNLISNALKYTPRGGHVSVEVSNGRGVTVSVKDTGIGILEEDLPRIFERFYRVDKARSRQSGGTGLGLAIVKNIVEAHGGEVRVTSDYNRGSCFTITLPNKK